MKSIFRFEFVVDGISRELAERLMDSVTITAELWGGKVYGGFVESEGEDEQPDADQNQ
jgi:hypothetical protein